MTCFLRKCHQGKVFFSPDRSSSHSHVLETASPHYSFSLSPMSQKAMQPLNMIQCLGATKIIKCNKKTNGTIQRINSHIWCGVPTSLDVLVLHGILIYALTLNPLFSRFETGFSGAHQQPILATPTPSAVAGELAAAWRDGSGSWGGGGSCCK